MGRVPGLWMNCAEILFAVAQSLGYVLSTISTTYVSTDDVTTFVNQTRPLLVDRNFMHVCQHCLRTKKGDSRTFRHTKCVITHTLRLQVCAYCRPTFIIKRSLITVNLINCIIFLPRGRDF